MSNNWIGKTNLSIVNVAVYSARMTVFLKSIDSSNKIKDHKYLYGIFKEVIEDIEEHNVMKIVTDNGLAYIKAGT